MNKNSSEWSNAVRRLTQRGAIVLDMGNMGAEQTLKSVMNSKRVTDPYVYAALSALTLTPLGEYVIFIKATQPAFELNRVAVLCTYPFTERDTLYKFNYSVGMLTISNKVISTVSNFEEFCYAAIGEYGCIPVIISENMEHVFGTQFIVGIFPGRKVKLVHSIPKFDPTRNEYDIYIDRYAKITSDGSNEQDADFDVLNLIDAIINWPNQVGSASCAGCSKCDESDTNGADAEAEAIEECITCPEYPFCGCRWANIDDSVFNGCEGLSKPDGFDESPDQDEEYFGELGLCNDDSCRNSEACCDCGCGYSENGLGTNVEHFNTLGDELRAKYAEKIRENDNRSKIDGVLNEVVPIILSNLIEAVENGEHSVEINPCKNPKYIVLVDNDACDDYKTMLMALENRLSLAGIYLNVTADTVCGVDIPIKITASIFPNEVE